MVLFWLNGAVPFLLGGAAVSGNLVLGYLIAGAATVSRRLLEPLHSPFDQEARIAVPAMVCLAFPVNMPIWLFVYRDLGAGAWVKKLDFHKVTLSFP